MESPLQGRCIYSTSFSILVDTITFFHMPEMRATSPLRITYVAHLINEIFEGSLITTLGVSYNNCLHVGSIPRPLIASTAARYKNFFINFGGYDMSRGVEMNDFMILDLAFSSSNEASLHRPKHQSVGNSIFRSANAFTSACRYADEEEEEDSEEEESEVRFERYVLYYACEKTKDEDGEIGGSLGGAASIFYDILSLIQNQIRARNDEDSSLDEEKVDGIF